MAQGLRAHFVFAEEPSLATSTRIRWLTALAITTGFTGICTHPHSRHINTSLTNPERENVKASLAEEGRGYLLWQAWVGMILT